MSTLTYMLILLLLSIGIAGAGTLVIEEINTGNGCPKVWNIPICIIILCCFLIPFVAHVLHRYHIAYFIATGIAVTIALIATVLQFTGQNECPKTDTGIPMCYYSLALFVSLILLKTYQLFITKTKKSHHANHPY